MLDGQSEQGKLSVYPLAVYSVAIPNLFAQLLSDSLSTLQTANQNLLAPLVETVASRLGLRINVAKTKTFGVDNLTMDGEPVEKVQCFSYLGLTGGGVEFHPPTDYFQIGLVYLRSF